MFSVEDKIILLKQKDHEYNWVSNYMPGLVDKKLTIKEYNGSWIRLNECRHGYSYNVNWFEKWKDYEEFELEEELFLV